MIKSGGIFPLFAAIPLLVAAAAPAIAKSVALGAVEALGTKAAQNIADSYEPKKGRGYKKGKGSNNVETGIINLNNSRESGPHWVAYAIDPRGIVYFDSYGLAPPKEFMRYISKFSIPIFFPTLPTQQLNDPPICGREVLNVLAEISLKSFGFPWKPPQVVANEYTSGK